LKDLNISENNDTILVSSSDLYFSQSPPTRIPCLNFTGSNYITNNNIGSELANKSFSLFAWINSTSTSDDQVFCLNNGSQRIIFGMKDGFIRSWNNQTGVKLGTTKINDGQWHYIGYVYDKVASKLLMYVDGAIVNEFTSFSYSVLNDQALSLGVYPWRSK
jgi:hypothetical protein